MALARHNIHAKKMFNVCDVARACDPSFAAQNSIPSIVDKLFAVIQPIAAHCNLRKLKLELPKYLSAAQDAVVSRDNVEDFSNAVLRWWKNSSEKAFPEWREAARIVFAMTPNSASCEHVFSLLKVMYGDMQDNCLADHLQASLMLRFNNRKVH